MGVYTGTIPTLLNGDVPSGDDLSNITGPLSALTTAWTAWTPTLTNLTLGNGTANAVYRQLNKTMDFDFLFTLGSTSAVGTNPKFSLPVTIASRHTATNYVTKISDVFLRDVSGGVTRPAIGFWATDGVELYYWNGTPTHTQITAAAPWAWAVGDSIHCTGTLELA